MTVTPNDVTTARAELPYAGTSGHSGGATSAERAVREDSTGITADRQAETLRTLAEWEGNGITWKELAGENQWHHGQASGVLSVLHKVGKIARLTERRQKCFVYVLPEHVNGRDTQPHGRKRPVLTNHEDRHVQFARRQADAGRSLYGDDLHDLLAIIDRLS